ncbi:MAG: bifunctional 2-C-methyl-D-erythritol 4-phosphate cytidylyltransferase/2-C-methyl-D-erythritol 2,4-cyclodiphosphate synthase [Rhodospirillales bacterium]|nr:bifunctional 2-C-methyl-D-erythritol 4-phosphate cytidylyltransferase/2-C-methyl-D-erythritol 2,4-cyclodiphosphate synthase [Rhodospirillales bacterium]
MADLKNGVIALVVAAGRGRRLGEELPKQYQNLGDSPLLRHTVQSLLSHPKIDQVKTVIHRDDIDLFNEATAGLDVLPPVNGGVERQDSVRFGLESLIELCPKLVLIHDAARPFIPHDLIDRVLKALETHKGTLPALPVVDTLKRGEDGKVGDTVDRGNLWRAQTPQGFDFETILKAHQKFTGQNLTDDCALAEKMGVKIVIVAGSEQNFKVTTPEDLAKARKEVTQQMDTCIGSGFDVHRFAEGDHVMLCGIKVPYDQTLKGHSDADVALHALTDALLGAIGAGDIGEHFPPSEPEWKGAPSSLFLDHAVQLIKKKNGQINNIDLTIICEEPKVGPFKADMRNWLSQSLSIPVERVSVKGTTTEKLGFTGRGEGIAAQAVVTIKI